MINNLGYIVLGLAPAFLWLVYYLKQDIHPEPKKEIAKTFIKGALAATLAGGIETILIKRYHILPVRGMGHSILVFGLIASVEEISKYLGMAIGAKHNPEIDEPIDVSEYMIASAMGFASLENIILFFVKDMAFLDTFFVSGFRFVGATLLHALASGIFGYFIANSFIYKKTKRGTKANISFVIGLMASIILHTLYNFSIIKTEGRWELLLPFIVISGGAVTLSYLLHRLKKLRSICYD